MNRPIWMLIVAFTLSLVPMGCSNSPASQPEFVGTWVGSGGGTISTVVFTETSFSSTDTGTSPGVFSSTIQRVDTGAKHILVICTASSGAYLTTFGISVGDSIYITYSISGNSLYLGVGTTSYPLATPAGPYIKQ